MIRVGDNESEFPVARGGGKQVQQRHRIRATGNGDDGGAGIGEEPRTREVRTEAVEEGRHILGPMHPDQIYQLLRHLTSPVVAVTSARDGKRNGMIADSAVRASIVPSVPRVAVYVHKFNYSHDLIFETGRLVLHLLRTDQFDLIHRLGFVTGRDRPKLDDIPHRLGALGAPVLDDCYAHFECRVANVMDTGSSTCFLGDVLEVGYGATDSPRGDRGEVMTAAYFRAHLPAEWRREYEEQLQAAQRFAAERSRDIRTVVWRGLNA